MSKIAVVYWSGTGNTEAMANAVVEGAQGKGAEVELIQCSDFTAGDISRFDAFAFGCPSMGAEALEETEFEPMFSSVEDSLSGEKVGLFGSWGWGNGAWMVDWEDRCRAKGMDLAGSVTCCEAPDEVALAECRDLGESLA